MGRKPSVVVEIGQQFGRLTVQELGHLGGKRAAVVSCSGPHEPLSKWVQLAALTSGAVQSCGCLGAEKAAERARERNLAAPPRLGTGKKGLPPGVKYVKKEKPYGSRIDDEGRECAYKGEGNCGHAYKPWSEFNKGNGAHGYCSWCRACQSTHAAGKPPRYDYSLAWWCKLFGITVEQYRALEAVHDGRCWLCREFETLTRKDGTLRRLSIDHDHACCDFSPTPEHPLCGNCIRGLCCHNCNRQVLGNVERVGADRVFGYLASAKAMSQAVLQFAG